MNEAAAATDFEELLHYLKHTRGFDFLAYKRATLERRVQKRMQTVEVGTYRAYRDYLDTHDDEFAQLFNTILINVTDFFRDQDAWDYLAQTIVPALIEKKGAVEPIRVWTAGCASGEEAYTLAMVFCEQLGVEAFKQRVKIYATDLDEDALNQARHAEYSSRDVENLPEMLRMKYFEVTGNRCLFDRDLRRCIIFGRHDLIQDAPISRVDLLICRNTLMYLNAEIQERILGRFHFALNEGGYLFLGKAETLLTHASWFLPVDLKRRVFGKVQRASYRERPLSASRGGHGEDTSRAGLHSKLRDHALDSAPVAQLAVDLNGTIVLANAKARSFFNLAARDIGKPLQDLELSYRPADLRSLIDEVVAKRRPVTLKDVEWQPLGGELHYFDVQVTALLDTGGNPQGSSVTFADVTEFKKLQADLVHFNHELETAYEELQSTNEELQTTNEELQSTVEELETTNEELQSTNEEMETINEELQSTNEELETLNEDAQNRSAELSEINAFLQSILKSIREGVVVLDPEMKVLAWNPGAEQLWGLRPEEVLGQHFMNLDIGLPVEQLKNALKGLQSKPDSIQEAMLESTNRRGKSFVCRVGCSSLLNSAGKASGIMLVMSEEK